MTYRLVASAVLWVPLALSTAAIAGAGNPLGLTGLVPLAYVTWAAIGDGTALARGRLVERVPFPWLAAVGVLFVAWFVAVAKFF